MFTQVGGLSWEIVQNSREASIDLYIEIEIERVD